MKDLICSWTLSTRQKKRAKNLFEKLVKEQDQIVLIKQEIEHLHEELKSQELKLFCADCNEAMFEALYNKGLIDKDGNPNLT